MHVVAYAAELAGGLGVVLLGTWLATSGLGIALGRRLGATRQGVPESGWKSFLNGLCGAGLLGANGTLPAGAAALARRAGMSVERTTLVVVGASFGSAVIALLAFLCSRGWALGALALVLLAVAAGTHALRTRWTPWGEAAAGMALTVVGLGLLASGWQGLAPWLRLATVDQRPILIPVMIVIGALCGLGLRSPGAAAALFVQGAATHALDGLNAAAGLIGVLASASWGSFESLRRGMSQERSVAAVHAAFTLLSAVFAGLIFAWGYRLPALVVKLPGGPAMAMTLLLFGALGAAAVVVALLQGPLHQFFMSRLAPRVSGSALARDLSAGCASIPGLSLGGLGGAVDAAAVAARDLARKELSGAGTTEQRRQQARAAATRAVEEIESFRAGLEGVRWPGEAIEAVLCALRGARTWVRVVDLLEELSQARMPSGDEALKRRFVRMRFGAMYRVEGVDEESHEVSAADLAAERELYEHELAGLREALIAACVAGSVRAENLGAHARHLDLLSELVRTALEAVESRERVETVSFRFMPDLPVDVEVIAAPEWEAEDHAESEFDEREPEEPQPEPPAPTRSVPLAGRR